MWGLSQKELLNGYGVAGSQASGILEFSRDPEGTMVKRLYGGRPAESGVVAANLARRGFTGPATVLEGHYGFLKVYSDAPKPAVLVDGIGTDFVIRAVQTKPYPSCAGVHTMVEAIGEVLKQRGLQTVEAKDIRTVDMGFPQKTLDQNMIPEPKSIMSAQYSAYFTGAIALMGRGADPGMYTEENMADPAIRALMGKVQGHEDAEMASLYPRYRPARIRITFADGTSGESTVLAPKGTLEKPFSPEEQSRRFDMLAGTVLTPDRCRELRDAIARLETFPDVRPFARLLATK